MIFHHDFFCDFSMIFPIYDISEFFYDLGKTGVTADRDKIEFRLFNSSSIFNITLR